ncbi:MAG: hypothetical protein KC656_19315 [Myxococcales bacterium]|nr:hypothetical protein [Myxococcales bacterium]
MDHLADVAWDAVDVPGLAKRGAGIGQHVALGDVDGGDDAVADAEGGGECAMHDLSRGDHRRFDPSVETT